MKDYKFQTLVSHGDMQLILVDGLENTSGKSLAIYNERTGNTLLRNVEPNLEGLERAVRILKGTDSGDY
jgi:hypothetical protein